MFKTPLWERDGIGIRGGLKNLWLRVLRVRVPPLLLFDKLGGNEPIVLTIPEMAKQYRIRNCIYQSLINRL